MDGWEKEERKYGTKKNLKSERNKKRRQRKGR